MNGFKKVFPVTILLTGFMLFFLSGCATSPSTTTNGGGGTVSYTVTFDSQGGTAVSNITVSAPATTAGTLPDAPLPDNFGFAGWYTETNGGGTEVTASTAE